MTLAPPLSRITPVILSGGSGTRLWPMSLPDRPKQFLALTGDATLFEATLARVADPARFTRPIVVANARHAGLVDAQLAGRDALVVLEPAARNTAPAIALAALAAGGGDAPLLVMPSDHAIADVAAFHCAIAAALPAVAGGALATFGIAPDGPETGYGYIRVGECVTGGVHRVACFVEKPDLAAAQAMLAAGDHLWNGGIFLFRADAYLAALARHAPDMLAAASAAWHGATRDGHRVTPDPQAFAASPANSIDYAVMEPASAENDSQVVVIPVAMGWSDIGSWDALHLLNATADGHAHSSSGGGRVVALDTTNCLFKSDGIRIAALGVSDLIVVATGTDVMILPRGRSQDVRRLVEALKE